VYVDIRTRLTNVEKGIAAMKARGADLTAVFRALRRPARADQKAHGTSRQAPDGPWPPRARATIARADKRSMRIHVSTQRRRRTKKGAGYDIRTMRRATNALGTLPTSLDARVRRDSLRLTSQVAWSEAQRSGATVGHGAVIPPRDFLWFSEEFLGMAANGIEQFVVGAWEGGTATRSRYNAKTGTFKQVALGRVKL
jgi:hypothetical protein